MAPRASMTYRADIDGLRALAVVLVVFGHAGVPGFGGGFFGVDVFFVISGFLITGLLIEEFRASGRFNAVRFYERRVRRLLPAFAIVALASLAAAAALLSPVELARHAREVAWSAAWMANIHQAWADTQYFGETRESGLFLHAWSLSVEEQFYLLWPIALLVAWRVMGQSSGLRRVIPLATLAAFVYAVWRAQVDPVSAYFMPDARAWQLMVGASAFLWIDARAPARTPRCLGAVGLLLVLSAALGFDKSSGNLMLVAALPTIGAALLLVAGSAGDDRLCRMLAWRWPVALGRVSYGWYLWHWPLLVFAAVVLPGDPGGVAWAVLVSLVLAAVMYRWVEQPIRGTRSRTPRVAVLLGVLGSLVIVFLAGQVAKQAGSHASDAAGMQRHPILEAVTFPAIYDAGCDDWYRSADLNPCLLSPLVEGRPTVVIVGDSIGLQWFPGLRQVFEARGWNVVVLTKSACAMVDRPFFYDRIGREYSECSQWRDSAIAFIRESDPDRVILGSAGSYPFGAEEWTEGTVDVLRAIAASGRRIDVLGPSPRLPFDGPECLMRHYAEIPAEATESHCTTPLAEAAYVDVERWLGVAVDRVPGGHFVETSSLVCPHETCFAWRDGRLVYRDFQHLNAEFTQSVEEELGRRLGLPLVEN